MKLPLTKNQVRLLYEQTDDYEYNLIAYKIKNKLDIRVPRTGKYQDTLTLDTNRYSILAEILRLKLVEWLYEDSNY